MQKDRKTERQSFIKSDHKNSNCERKNHVKQKKDKDTETEIGERTRTAWAVFKYCGTKTAPLRR